MNADVAEFIKKAKAQGYSDDQVRQSLIQSGYDSKTINEALSPPPEEKSSWNIMANLAYGTQWLLVALCQLLCGIGVLTCLIMAVGVFAVKSDLKTGLDSVNAVAITGAGFAFTTNVYLGVIYSGTSNLRNGFINAGNQFAECSGWSVVGDPCRFMHDSMHSISSPFGEISSSTYSTMQSVNKLRQDFDHLAQTTGILSATINLVVPFIAGFFGLVAMLFGLMMVIVDQVFRDHWKLKELEEKLDKIVSPNHN